LEYVGGARVRCHFLGGWGDEGGLEVE